MYNYICHHVYVNSKKYERIGDTVDFFPHHTKMLFMSSAGRASLSAVDLTETLLYTNPEAPFSNIGDTLLAALRQICKYVTRPLEQTW